MRNLVALSARTSAIQKVIRAVKADHESLRLQNEFVGAGAAVWRAVDDHTANWNPAGAMTVTGCTGFGHANCTRTGSGSGKHLRCALTGGRNQKADRVWSAFDGLFWKAGAEVMAKSFFSGANTSTAKALGFPVARCPPVVRVRRVTLQINSSRTDGSVPQGSLNNRQWRTAVEQVMSERMPQAVNALPQLKIDPRLLCTAVEDHRCPLPADRENQSVRQQVRRHLAPQLKRGRIKFLV